MEIERVMTNLLAVEDLEEQDVEPQNRSLEIELGYAGRLCCKIVLEVMDSLRRLGGRSFLLHLVSFLFLTSVVTFSFPASPKLGYTLLPKLLD